VGNHPSNPGYLYRGEVTFFNDGKRLGEEAVNKEGEMNLVQGKIGGNKRGKRLYVGSKSTRDALQKIQQ